jgi:hypothetical protein
MGIGDADQRRNPAGKGQRNIQQVLEIAVRDAKSQGSDDEGATGVPGNQRRDQGTASGFLYE